ncbi:hypothetical protein QJS66_17575 [Kocuria rhizophila]|nr:hypothetical protein QJS66_17575 [Kocuria rhizophila]
MEIGASRAPCPPSDRHPPAPTGRPPAGPVIDATHRAPRTCQAAPVLPARPGAPAASALHARVLAAVAIPHSTELPPHGTGACTSS